ncbi:MAG: VOC family protein [Spirochaetaceae bacterium]|jgi:catechol 2,3-dioxygenase-like lactoylglutathione lyase family enzyme|nr:VOC family protein [Spirochaetaceae bacterium]
MAGIIESNTLTQVAFIVRDVEQARIKFAEFLGVSPPAVVDGGKFEITGTQYRGKPAPDVNCLMAFFDAGPHVQIELIQPNGAKSVWQDYLDEHGEGLHHIAFGVKGMDDKIRSGEEFGLPCVQRGKYGNGGGEYAYLDARKDLKCYIELLENYSQEA